MIKKLKMDRFIIALSFFTLLAACGTSSLDIRSVSVDGVPARIIFKKVTELTDTTALYFLTMYDSLNYPLAGQRMISKPMTNEEIDQIGKEQLQQYAISSSDKVFTEQATNGTAFQVNVADLGDVYIFNALEARGNRTNRIAYQTRVAKNDSTSIDDVGQLLLENIIKFENSKKIYRDETRPDAYVMYFPRGDGQYAYSFIRGGETETSQLIETANADDSAKKYFDLMY